MVKKWPTTKDYKSTAEYMARIWNTRMAAEYMEFKGMIVSFRCQQCGPDSPILDFGQALKHMPFEHHIMPILHWQVKDIES